MEVYCSLSMATEIMLLSRQTIKSAHALCTRVLLFPSSLLTFEKRLVATLLIYTYYFLAETMATLTSSTYIAGLEVDFEFFKAWFSEVQLAVRHPDVTVGFARTLLVRQMEHVLAAAQVAQVILHTAPLLHPTIAGRLYDNHLVLTAFGSEGFRLAVG